MRSLMMLPLVRQPWAALVVAAFLAHALATPALADEGATVFARCAACHTASGAGVPGAYPPLTAELRILATRPEGRRYLALVVVKGLMGPLKVAGQSYNNVMPAQGGMNPAQIAAVLNHIGADLVHTGPAFHPFTAEEVTGYVNGAGAIGPGELVQLHARIAGK